MNIIKAADVEQAFNVGIVVSRSHDMITQRLYEGAVARLNELKVTSNLITVVWTPHIGLIPLTAQSLIDTNHVQAVIALGAIILDNAIYNESLHKQVNMGCQQVMLENVVPVVLGVLTTKDEVTALDMAGGARGNIGAQTVDYVFDMLSIMRQISELKFK